MKKHIIASMLLLAFCASLFAADLPITASAVVPSNQAQKANGVAGATIAAGETVFLQASDNKYYLADGNDTNKMPVHGIAANSASAGQPITILVSDPNLTIGTHGQDLGTPFFQSANAGKVCPLEDVTTGNQTTAIFITKTTTTVVFSLLGPGGTVPTP